MNFNPMLDYQRNQLMAQQALIQNQLNQMNQPQFTPYPQNNTPQFFVRQIGHIEEAKGYPVDPNTIYFFLDSGNGKIYMKQLNTTNGKSDFFTYSVQEQTEEKKNDPIEQINERLTNIEKIIGGIYDKSVSDVAESNGCNATANVTKNAKPKSADVSAGSANDKREE